MLDKAEWESRFKAQIVKRLTGEGSIWTAEQAAEAAEHEYQGNTEYPDYLDDPPEDAADECLSYWDADE